MVKFINALRSSGVAVVGAGGAGDIVSAYVMCEVLNDLFGIRKCVPVAILWERWVLDPFPGPVPRSLVRNARFSKCAWVNPETKVVRPGYSFTPQAAAVAEVMGREVPAVTLERGAVGFRECLEELVGLGYGHIMALDVGGDILAEGHEEWLWSPLTDALTVAAIDGLDSSVAVLAPGADGELPTNYVLERIEEVAEAGGFIGVIGLWRDHAHTYEKILPKTKTESGLIPYRALKGMMRKDYIRGGSRAVDVNPTSPVIYVLETQAVIKATRLPKALRNTKSLAEALTKAHQLRIPTELDLEITIAKNHGCGPQTKPDWNKAKQQTINKITQQPPKNA